MRHRNRCLTGNREKMIFVEIKKDNVNQIETIGVGKYHCVVMPAKNGINRRTKGIFFQITAPYARIP